ncbi:putative Histidine kinase [Hibiscus syriacus]|uniref:Histidine kinase n=1 Tax=Hibiscus syriacus TaxID=106335 RepID=A0A6A3CVL8_HIBSY|nr:golgin subfamily A member 6-like protein 1 [Hibiscus syriacus]KAE8732474.1 putative Histidine kinase [Hibiscus syriacus]
MANSGTSSFRNLSKTFIRSFSTKSSHHNNHQATHIYLDPNSFLGSWKSPNDPKVAEKKLAQLRRDYAKQVKNVRKEYIQEMELLRLEKLRKEEARKEAIRVANEERKRLKAEAAKVRAQERMVAEEEFRQTLLKERAEKLENWRMKQKLHENKKKEANELLRRSSSMWIEENELEKKILEAVMYKHD